MLDVGHPKDAIGGLKGGFSSRFLFRELHSGESLSYPPFSG
jgi:hypothetical protein